jgi:hypothetical protein
MAANDDYDMFTLADFKVGQRIELHPATNLWMAGARYGTMVRLGRKHVHVRLDRVPGVKRVPVELLRPVPEW